MRLRLFAGLVRCAGSSATPPSRDPAHEHREQDRAPPQPAGGARARSSAHSRRAPLSARRDLGRARRQFRAVLGPCHQGRALPVRRRRASARSSASSCPNTPTRSGTAICRTRGPARSTAIACTARTSRKHGHRFNPNKLLLDPYAKALVGELHMGPGGVRLHASDAEATTCPSTSATARRSCRNAASSIRPSPGATNAARRRRGTAPSSTKRMCAASPSCIPTCREELRGTFAGLGRSRRSSTTSARSASPRSSCCRSTPSSTTAISLDKGLTQLLGLQHDRLLRARAALLRRPAFAFAEFKEMVAQLARRRHRGHPRRRLQPHRRRQRARPDAVVQGHRQRLLLPAAARPAALLHQRHRHRQHGQPQSIRACCRW